MATLDHCSIEGCERKFYARGMCNLHYQRARRAGLGKLDPESAETRFWSKVNKTDDCWIWGGHKNPKGYGQFWIKDRLVMAHLVSYEWANGPVPDGTLLDHFTCFNHACVNPAHLRPVTPKQNLENRAGAQANSKSGVRGVHWDRRRNCWRAQVNQAGRNHYAGQHPTIEEATAAAIAKRNELFTHNELDRRLVTRWEPVEVAE